MFERTLVAGWGDMDFNAHMRNTAYLDKSADVRMMYFAEHGFPMSEFARLQLGPVVMRDQIDYFRECRLLDEIRVTLALAGLSEDGSRMTLRNEFHRDGQLCARVTSTVGWFDLRQRKLIVPPPELAALLRALDRSEDFAVLPGSAR
ncbi:thioesterase [Massilia sp. KIM]|uniref:acyl-CoA thioesterase n=1 Tax=Massilia sp. KIM TaxID=1955422 RepID=UPI00098F47AF|nr:thioesterase family protein [Massilia sp. KIM]OON61082.1 thioesterase [Massilia sp. KIM]